MGAGLSLVEQACKGGKRLVGWRTFAGFLIDENGSIGMMTKIRIEIMIMPPDG